MRIAMNQITVLFCIKMLLQFCAVNNYKVCAKQSLFNNLHLQHYKKCRKSGRDTLSDFA